jgi:MFS family permease
MRAGAPGPIALGALFGALYFVQGIGEPTAGLIAQPVRSMLKQWGEDAATIAWWSALLGLPSVAKPIYGLISDFLPFRGQRRRSYLILTCGLTAAALTATSLVSWEASLAPLLLLALGVPAVSLAFSDVVIDALMVELGQPRGLTGRFQSIQWAASYTATIAAGFVGGYLAQTEQQPLGFLLCGAFALGSLALLYWAADEPARPPPAGTRGEALRALFAALRAPGVVGVAAFLFLWNFNPFSWSVLYVHMTRELGFSEQHYGTTVSVFSVAAVLASASYATYCRRVPLRALLHASIVLGVASTACYLALRDERSALLISGVSGFAYMTGTLILLDLAARTCPPALAGTLFATLMAVSNLGISLSEGLGGSWYEAWSARFNTDAAFSMLVATGALFTSLCWLLLPVLARGVTGRIKRNSTP